MITFKKKTIKTKELEDLESEELKKLGIFDLKRFKKQEISLKANNTYKRF